MYKNHPKSHEIIQLYIKEKKSLGEVSKLVKSGHDTVKKIIIAHGYKTRKCNEMRERNLDPKLLSELYNERRMTTFEISEYYKKMGIKSSHITVSKYLKKYNLKKSSLELRALRDKNYRIWSEEKINKIKDFLESGYSYTRIAEEFNCAYHVIASVVFRRIKIKSI